jgi:zinc protease
MIGCFNIKTEPASANSGINPDNYPEVFRLANGLQVVIQPDKRFPLVSMRLYVHAGSAYETDKEAGISHLLEHMVFKGTQRRPTGSLAEDIEKIGGYCNAATSFDYTVYIAELPAQHWRVGLDVLEDMAFHPSLVEKELASEKKVVIAELKRGEDNPNNLLFKQIQTTTLASTPYEHPVIGYENIINSITRKDMLNYINRHYQPQSSMLLVCGNVDVNALKKEIQKIYAPLKNTQAVKRPELVDINKLPEAGPNITIQKGPWNKIYLGLALPGIAQTDARSVHLDILSALLADGKTSYLYRKYKYELQLVDQISFSNYGLERLGLLYFTVQLSADKLTDFWDEFVKDLKNLDSITFTEQELNRVKLNIENELFRSKETLSGLTSKLGHFEFFEDGTRSEENYLYSLRKATLPDVYGQLKDLVQPARMSVALLTPEEYSAITAEQLQSALLKDWPQEQISAGKSANPDEQKNEVIELGPGRKLILIPDNTLPYVSASLMFTGGDALLNEKEQGLAAATASLLSKGSGKLSAKDYEDFLADRAASLGINTGRQSFAVNFTFPARFSSDIFDLLQTTLDKPAFAEEELTRVKNNQISAIKATEDQPLSLAFRKIFPFLFGNHPYGYMQLGNEETVETFTAAEVRAFWDKQKNESWVLAVCGSFEREAVIAAANKLPVPVSLSKTIAVPEWNKDKNLVVKMPGRNQTHLMLIFPTVPLADEDAAEINLLQNILDGQSGLLFSELRDKQGLGYTVTAIPWNGQKSGMLIFYIGTEPDKLAQARAGFFKIIERLNKDKLPSADLERGKNSIQGEYYRNHQSLLERSSEAATLAILGLPLDLPQKQIAESAKVTPEELRAIVRKYLKTENYRELLVEP